MDLSKKKKSGFTLIELMIVVAIIGILAALAIPAFLGYVRRSKSTEVTVGLDNMFKSMSTYYSQQNASSAALGAATTIHCSLAAIPWAQALPDTSPNDTKRLFPVATIGTTWGSVKGAIAGYVYYSYYFDARPSGCDVPPGTPDIYTFRGAGNLDNDAVLSSFSIAAGSDSANVLYRARAFNVVNELE